ncbi:MAG: hypothetical protein IPJ41_04415 [Phycisphaerales bacterium]|nr:hypothetical protein [Phycisphaerales bacterium]
MRQWRRWPPRRLNAWSSGGSIGDACQVTTGWFARLTALLRFLFGSYDTDADRLAIGISRELDGGTTSPGRKRAAVRFSHANSPMPATAAGGIDDAVDTRQPARGRSIRARLAGIDHDGGGECPRLCEQALLELADEPGPRDRVQHEAAGHQRCAGAREDQHEQPCADGVHVSVPPDGHRSRPASRHDRLVHPAAASCAGSTRRANRDRVAPHRRGLVVHGLLSILARLTGRLAWSVRQESTANSWA